MTIEVSSEFLKFARIFQVPLVYKLYLFLLCVNFDIKDVLSFSLDKTVTSGAHRFHEFIPLVHFNTSQCTYSFMSILKARHKKYILSPSPTTFTTPLYHYNMGKQLMLKKKKSCKVCKSVHQFL